MDPAPAGGSDTISGPWLSEITSAALDALRLPAQAWVEVVLTDDETMRDLNLRHRGLSETTDVLSFEGGDGDDFVVAEGGDSIGEVIISLPYAERQAAAAGRDLDDQVAFLLAHGLLHLVGHDHQEAVERARMEREHRRLLEAMLGPRSSGIEVSYPS